MNLGTEMYDLLLVLSVVAGTFIRYTLGFGFSMLFVPAASLVIGFPEAVETAILLELVVSTIVAITLWRHFELFEATFLKVAGLLGVFIGQVVLEYVSTSVLTTVSMTLLIFFASIFLHRQPVFAQNHKTLAVAGISSGVLNTWASMSGPPVVLYYYSTDRSQVQTRAALNSYFLILYAASFLSFYARGSYTPEDMRRISFCVVAAVISLLALSLIRQWHTNGAASPRTGVEQKGQYRTTALWIVIAVAAIALVRVWSAELANIPLLFALAAAVVSIWFATRIRIHKGISAVRNAPRHDSADNFSDASKTERGSETLGVIPRGKSGFRAMLRRLYELAGALHWPRYAVPIVILLTGAMVTLSYRGELGDRLLSTRPGTNSDSETSPVPPTERKVAAGAVGRLSRDGVARTANGETNTGSAPTATADEEQNLEVVTSVRSAAKQSGANRPQMPRDDGLQEVALRRSHSIGSKRRKLDPPLTEYEVGVVSLRASQTLSHALALYWVGDASGAIGKLKNRRRSTDYGASDGNAIGELRARLQRIRRRYADGQGAFLHGHRAQAFESWRHFLIEEQALGLPTWSRFALEVKARVVDEYTMLGDIAHMQGRLRAARHLWARARSIVPGGRAAKSLARLEQRSVESADEAPMSDASLDQLADVFADDLA